MRAEDVKTAAGPAQQEARRILVRLIPEESGFSVYSPSLPGAASQGETEAEALDNIREAIAGLIESYRDLGETTPWQAISEGSPQGEWERWISIHA